MLNKAVDIHIYWTDTRMVLQMQICPTKMSNCSFNVWKYKVLQVFDCLRSKQLCAVQLFTCHKHTGKDLDGQ